jgi:hypothetical protein
MHYSDELYGEIEITDPVLVHLSLSKALGDELPRFLWLVKLLENIRSVELPKYHDYTNLALMVSLLFVLQRAENTMKNTIDDADYIINRIVFILYNQ